MNSIQTGKFVDIFAITKLLFTIYMHIPGVQKLRCYFKPSVTSKPNNS